MALLNNLGQYIKLDKDGAFEIYISKEARECLKQSTSFEVIIKKYQEIITEIRSDKYIEERYYNPTEYWAWVREWEAEYQQYCYQVFQGPYNENISYPLMTKYYSDVADSVPKIIARGHFGSSLDTAAAAYDVAKTYHNWGETIDV